MTEFCSSTMDVENGERVVSNLALFSTVQENDKDLFSDFLAAMIQSICTATGSQAASMLLYELMSERQTETRDFDEQTTKLNHIKWPL